MDTPVVAHWHGNDVDLTTIERQLVPCWAQAAQSAPAASAIRTSIFNLVVYTDSQESAQGVCEKLDRLAGGRPSRAIVLAVDRNAAGCSVDAEVRVQCQWRAGDQSFLGYEQLIITAHGRVADHPASLVDPLLVAELPTYLWWPGQPPFGHRIFRRLLAVADQLVVDSAQFRSPGDGIADIGRLCSGQQGVNDLHWARLTHWRDIIAQIFDDPACLPYVGHISSIRLDCGAGGNEAPANAATLLLLGWMASRLGWEPESTLDRLAREDVTLAVLQDERLIPIELRFRDHGSAGAGELIGVELVAEPEGKPPARFNVARTDDLQLVRVDTAIQGSTEMSRLMPLAVKSDEELLADELGLTGHDRLYEGVIEMASRMAGREGWMPA